MFKKSTLYYELCNHVIVKRFQNQKSMLMSCYVEIVKHVNFFEFNVLIDKV